MRPLDTHHELVELFFSSHKDMDECQASASESARKLPGSRPEAFANDMKNGSVTQPLRWTIHPLTRETLSVTLVFHLLFCYKFQSFRSMRIGGKSA